MDDALPCHPDRRAATLAQLVPVPAGARCLPPGDGSHDCRIDLKLLQWQAERAAAASPAAAAHLARWPRHQHPDLWAGTVQDGVARGLAVALEEAIALAGTAATDPFLPVPEHAPGAPPDRGAPAGWTFGKALRKRKEILIASSGARVRFSRKLGVLFVARDEQLHSSNSLWFEARRDRGDLDRFASDPAERNRLFSAQFLPAESLYESADTTQLRLVGRLGRADRQWPIVVTLLGRRSEARVRLRIELRHPPADWRLRARFLGLPAPAIHHHCTDVRETVQGVQGPWSACTLVRSCGWLQVGDERIAVPSAAHLLQVRHDFELGTS
jgi:hypothetical protein